MAYTVILNVIVVCNYLNFHIWHPIECQPLRKRLIKIRFGYFSYTGEGIGDAGLFIYDRPLGPAEYFEVDIVNNGLTGSIGKTNLSLNTLPGRAHRVKTSANINSNIVVI